MIKYVHGPMHGPETFEVQTWGRRRWFAGSYDKTMTKRILDAYAETRAKTVFVVGEYLCKRKRNNIFASVLLIGITEGCDSEAFPPWDRGRKAIVIPESSTWSDQARVAVERVLNIF